MYLRDAFFALMGDIGIAKEHAFVANEALPEAKLSEQRAITAIEDNKRELRAAGSALKAGEADGEALAKELKHVRTVLASKEQVQGMLNGAEGLYATYSEDKEGMEELAEQLKKAKEVSGCMLTMWLYLCVLRS